MKHMPLILSAALMVGIAASASAVLGPAFSLDDNPAAPLTSPPGWIPGFGAEDPFGLGTYGPGLAPSPTLAPVPAMDADILMPNPTGLAIPMVDLPMSPMYNQKMGYVNAVSDNKSIRPQAGIVNAAKLHLGFSVDRISRGLANTAVNKQFMLNQQPGDIFRSDQRFPHPSQFLGMPSPVMGYAGVLPSAGIGGGNLLLFDESWLNLTAGNGPGTIVGPGFQCPPIGRMTHDNTDAVNWQLFDVNPQDRMTDKLTYFSVAPDERAISGFGPADIMVIPPMLPANAAVLFAPANSMGLYGFAYEMEDDIDALAVWDDPAFQPGFGDPMVDCALFSLSHGSPSLNQYGLSESDIFFTDFSGCFWLYARGGDIGLLWYGPMEGGDNVDALDVMLPGDANLDGVVDIQDFVILKQNYGTGSQWTQGDFNGDGVVDIQDFVILKQFYGMTT